MREILFRGKRKEDGKWIEGYLVRVNDKYFISDADATFGMNGEILDCHCIDPETVGQYTGLNDENGKKIFEGDVTKYECMYHDEYYEIGFGYGSFNHREIGKQKLGTSFDDGEFGLGPDNMKVIGNIHDNPELLEVK